IHRPSFASSGPIVQPIVLLYVGLHALVISALSGLGPISMHEWGQRYLLPAYPALVALALLAGWRIWSLSRERVKRTTVICLLVSAVLALAGIGFTVRGYVM